MATLKTIQILSHPDILGGKPHLEGRRIPVDLIVFRALYQGWGAEQIEQAYQISRAEIHAALSYYYNNEAEIDAIIREEEADDQPMPRISDLNGILDALIDTESAAKSLGISERGVRKLIDSGTLPAKKIGGKWLIHPRDLQRQQVQDRRPGPRSLAG